MNFFMAALGFMAGAVAVTLLAMRGRVPTEQSFGEGVFILCVLVVMIFLFGFMGIHK